MLGFFFFLLQKKTELYGCELRKLHYSNTKFDDVLSMTHQHNISWQYWYYLSAEVTLGIDVHYIRNLHFCYIITVTLRFAVKPSCKTLCPHSSLLNHVTKNLINYFFVSVYKERQRSKLKCVPWFMGSKWRGLPGNAVFLFINMSMTRNSAKQWEEIRRTKEKHVIPVSHGCNYSTL